MYIQQAFISLHEWWRYLVGFIIIFLASQLGSIPLLIAVMFKVMAEGGNIESIQDPNVMMTVLDSNLTLFLMLLSFAIGLLGVYLVVKFLHKQPFVALTTSRKKTDWGRVFFGFALIAITTIVVTSLDFYNNPENYVLQFDLVPFIILAVIAVIMIPLQTSFEEYLFRGYLMQGIGVLTKNRWLPLIVTSVIFGALHMANPEVDKLGNIIMIYYIGTGFFLGIMTLMDEGMELALGFHAGNNLIAALLVTADWTVFKTNSVLKDISEPSAGFDVIAPVLILYPIFLLIMAWRYKWTDWSGKLFGKVEEPINISDENTQNQTFVE
ncbi:MAG: CPBP family intramembrane metalloprotease domain-containing protein [Aequorivita sp.]|mgnify:FL=1|jgi:membrane protease YdiL (CAAX protease family)|nr:CPBP family intramembrane metalloprotease domain-containing protein [Aequorivita sp.]MBP42178.1 CPBP family intramembrane metalloprotease domain-containing protein [Aequorivita sp.]HBC04256.1 CPBP family intramembrane metalloprotease domain-containing protein [Aequorivita sp.]|tara:strand:- start:6014 stop:6985 length:972 start_codon:yes stop_codon:yes gene_type:complete